MWKHVDTREFLNKKGNKRVRAHVFNRTVAHWPYCSQCGLVKLKNDVSRKAADGKCVVWEDV